MNRNKGIVITLLIMALMFLGTTVSSAQKLAKTMYIQASAMGTSTQLGRMTSVNIIINEYSTADDQKILIEAFQEKGSEGVANSLHKMKAKGRIAITGTLGYDVNYIRLFKMPDGSKKIRFVTDRPITFGEVWSSSRSSDYNLSMGEIIISAKKGSSAGTLIPAAEFQIKDKELSVEAFQNPWKLVNIRVSN